MFSGYTRSCRRWTSARSNWASPSTGIAQTPSSVAQTAVLPVRSLDTGPDGIHPGAHLRRMLDRIALLGDGAVRIPAWRLFDDPRWIAQQLTA